MRESKPGRIARNGSPLKDYDDPNPALWQKLAFNLLTPRAFLGLRVPVMRTDAEIAAMLTGEQRDLRTVSDALMNPKWIWRWKA